MRTEQSDLPKLTVLRLQSDSMSGSTSTKTCDDIPYYYKNTLIMRSVNDNKSDHQIFHL